MDHDELKKIRIEIDRTNRSLISLFERRMELVRSVAEYKRERGLPVYDAAREKEVIEQCSGWVRDPEYRGGCLWLMDKVMEASRRYENEKISAEEGARHRAASAGTP